MTAVTTTKPVIAVDLGLLDGTARALEAAELYDIVEAIAARIFRGSGMEPGTVEGNQVLTLKPAAAACLRDIREIAEQPMLPVAARRHLCLAALEAAGFGVGLVPAARD